jgi:hypothetical protein
VSQLADLARPVVRTGAGFRRGRRRALALRKTRAASSARAVVAVDRGERPLRGQAV